MLEQKRILVVDDEAHITNVLALKLRNGGFEVHVANNGQEALSRLVEVDPDLMLTDYSMPVMNGLELIEAIRGLGDRLGMPVIMLTARGQTVEQETRERLGITDILNKPFSPREVLARVKDILGVTI